MSYSLIGFVAIVILIILNSDVLWGKLRKDIPAQRQYRSFLYGVLVFFLVDALWGVFYELHWSIALFADTTLYFAMLMATILLWTHYVIAYLERGRVFGRIYFIAGIALFVIELAALIVNFFVPVVFWVDESCGYHAGNARYLAFLMQLGLFLPTTVYTLVISQRTKGAVRRRHRTIAVFGIAMMVMVVLQILTTSLPFSSVGYLLGVCLIHAFVVEGEKEEHRERLEALLEHEKQQTSELSAARRIIQTDPLTGVKSKQAYLEDEEKFNRRISEGAVEAFGVAVFDLNDLKEVNDTLGHDTGDIWIYSAAMLISEFFSRSPVYRIGGDEFAAILLGEDYRDRERLLAAFERQAEENQQSGKVVVSSGMSEYYPTDTCFRDVFERADKNMYRRKHWLKEQKQ